MFVAFKRRYKIDIDEIASKAFAEAFSETRNKCNEEGLTNKALDEKKGVIAIRETVRLFMAAALTDTSTPDDRRQVEEIAQAALEQKDGCIDYLRQYCEEA